MSLDEAAPPQNSRDAFEARIDRLRRLPSSRFSDLARSIGQRPEIDLRFGDFSGCRFDGDDVRGFDLTGCDLRGATFSRATIEGAKFDCAQLDAATLREAVDHAAYLKTELAREAATRHRVTPSRLGDLAVFREAPFAPEMVVIPAGEFLMGYGERGEFSNDFSDDFGSGAGKRRMRIPLRFSIGRYPVTFEEYDLFCGATGREKPDDQKAGRARWPVINVSRNDAQA